MTLAAASRAALAALLLAAAGRAAAAPPADGRIRIAVLEPRPLGDVAPDVPVTLGGLAAAQLAKTGVFLVITGEDLRQMLSVETTKMKLGCEDAACLAELGGALGAPYILSGTIGRLGSTLVVTLTLLEIAEAKTVAREVLSVDDVGRLARELEPSLARLVAPLLYREAGTLAVRCNVEGALVHVDGASLGTVPLGARQVAAGPRSVRVTKEGFVEARQDVLVRPRAETVVDVVLVPSREFVESYRRHALRTRLGAWATTGGALLAGAGGAGLFFWSASVEGRLREEAGVGPGDPLPVSPAQSRQFLARDVGGFALAGISAALAGVAIYLFATGDPPDRYGAPGHAVSPSSAEGR